MTVGDPLQTLFPDSSELAALAPADQRRLLLRVAALLAALGARELEPQRPAADDTLLTMSQVAKRLGVPGTAAYTLARQGRLPVIRIGKYVRMRPADLAAFIEANQDVSSFPRRRPAATERR